MKLFTATAAALLIAVPAHAQANWNYQAINAAQSAISEVLSWNLAGNTDKTCAALAKAERSALALNDEVAMEAGIKAQAQSMRSFLLRMNVFCAL